MSTFYWRQCAGGIGHCRDDRSAPGYPSRPPTLMFVCGFELRSDGVRVFRLVIPERFQGTANVLPRTCRNLPDRTRCQAGVRRPSYYVLLPLAWSVFHNHRLGVRTLIDLSRTSGPRHLMMNSSSGTHSARWRASPAIVIVSSAFPRQTLRYDICR